MWNSRYFKRIEFACKCGCGDAQINLALLPVLDDVREHFGAPVVVNSGKRCKKHNQKVGGAKNSVHMTGKAADVRFQSNSKTPVSALHQILLEKYPDKYGIASADSFTHIDVRPKKSRWSY